MAGYWDRPVETRETLDENGWLHTGDAARIDDEGFVWIVDRRRRRVRRVRARRVPGRHRARRSGATLPSSTPAWPRPTAKASAFVVLAPGADVTEDELLEFSRAQLEPHEVPRSITFLDRLPRNSVGKLLRHDLLRAHPIRCHDPIHLVANSATCQLACWSASVARRSTYP